MKKKNILVGNKQREFDKIQIDQLGQYVYALKDSRDGNIFYVGKGKNNRLFSHFNEAETYLKSKRGMNSDKINKIIEIWHSGKSVDWAIIAHNLGNEVDCVEAAVIDALRVSPNRKLLNTNRGKHSSYLNKLDVECLSAKPINPGQAITVFVFPIHNELEKGKSLYDATRGDWRVGSVYRNIENAYAVGLTNKVSVSSYRIDSWQKSRDGKFYFDGREDKISKSLLLKNWNNIISNAGNWTFGQYVIVNFDENGHFEIIRGVSENKRIKHHCL